MPTEPEPTTAQVCLETGRLLAQPIDLPGGQTLLALPPGYTLQSLDKYQPRPLLAQGDLRFDSVVSFAQYVKRHATPTTHLFGCQSPDSNEPQLHVLAVLEWHDPSGPPSWGRHRATYNARPTPEWRDLLRNAGSWMSQQDFASWLQDNQALFLEPKGAELLECISHLEGTNNARFKSALRLQDGQTQLLYEEEVTVRGGGGGVTQAGTFTLPESFAVELPLFEGMQPQALTARLYYQIEKAEVRFRYKMINPVGMFRDAYEKLRLLVESMTGLSVYQGWPQNLGEGPLNR